LPWKEGHKRRQLPQNRAKELHRDINRVSSAR
jgi:hypothetical protein